MKKIVLFLMIIAAFYGCNPSNPLDKWKAGSSNRDASLLQDMKDNGLLYLEAGWPNSTRQSVEETEKWAQEMNESAKKAGITIWSVHLPYGGVYDISKTDEEERKQAVLLNSRDMEMSSRMLRPQYFIIHPSAEPISDEERAARFESSRKSLKTLAAQAKECNVVLLVENLPRTCLGNTSTEMLQIIDDIDNTAICFDTNHLLKESHASFIANTKGKIKSTHMSDYDGIDEKHWLPGVGVINWTELLKGLVETGYKGPFIFEASKTKSSPVTMEDRGNCWKELKETAYK